MPTVSAETLRSMMHQMLAAAGTPDELAESVADGLIDANLTGHDSHGVIRVIQYLEEVGKGNLDPTARPEVEKIDGATAQINGHWGWGQPAFWMATRSVETLAREYGIAIAVVQCCYHIGRVAPYVEFLARQNLIAMAMANAGPAVAPFGGSARVMGTNPIAWAVPRAEQAPISLDVATAFIAEGKVRVARAKGVEVPANAVIDIDGNPTLDPNHFYEGGALMTFGAHKGSGFSILAQLMGAGLALQSQERLQGRRGSNGPVIIAIDPARFGPLFEFESRIESEAERITGSRPVAGIDRVLLPGEPELANRLRREVEGVPVPDSTWTELLEIAESQGIDATNWRSEARA